MPSFRQAATLLSQQSMSCSILRRLAICVAAVSLLAFAVPRTAGAQDSPPHSHGQDRHNHEEGVTPPLAAENRDHAHTGAFPVSQQLVVLAFYSIVIAAASLVGGWLPGRISLSHVSFQILVSLVGGLMIGIAVLHLLPHSIHELGVARLDLAAQWTLAGILLMFVLLRTLHVHHHDPSAPTPTELPVIQQAHDHDHDCGHDHPPEPALVSHDACAHQHGSSRLSWLGAALGLGIHTVMDGLALGAAMRADAGHANSFGLFGLGIFLAVALHKPLDSLSITTMMVAAGKSPTARLTVNILYALLCPLGAALVIVGAGQPGPGVQLVIGASLAFSAGVFLCIALADLLPEMQFHSHNQLTLSAALLAGVVLAWAVGFLEPAHLHH